MQLPPFLIIYFFSVSDVQCGYNKPIIFYHTNHSIIADSIPPLTAPVCCKPFSMLSRVSAVNKVFVDPRLNHALCITVEFFELFIKTRGSFNAIPHRLHSFQSSEIGALFLPALTYSA